MAEQQQSQSGGKISLPGVNTLNNAAKLSIKFGRPLDFYFYIDSCRGNAQIVNADGEKIIYKNNNEHTSPIKHTYKTDNEYLIVTENTIYVLSANTSVNTGEK